MPEQKRTIMVVDDEPGLVKFVQGCLEYEGYGVITAKNGEVALKCLKEGKPDLILLDIMMPGLDGYQVCERVRESMEIPIIMLTAKNRPQDMAAAIRIGADDYITKPFGADELLDRMEGVFRRYRHIKKSKVSS